MAELVPAIHVLFNATMKGGWFHLITNRRNGVLYSFAPTGGSRGWPGQARP